MGKAGVTATLMISCAEQKGLVATVSDFVFRHGGNIIHADQHTDQEEAVFLQRVEFELDGLDIDRSDIGEAFRPIAERFEMRWAVRFSDHTPRLALLVSKQGHCMYDLLARWRMGDLHAEIPVVVSNHPDHAEVAEHYGVVYHHLPVTSENKAEQEAAVLALLASERVDLVVLARYMRVLSADFVAPYPNRIINIHHSFLPAFAGAHPYRRAHERGVKIIGATAHYVTAALDQGPIIDQDVTRASHRDTVQDLVRKGRDLEKIVLARAVRLHLENRVLVYRNKTVVFD